MTRDMAVLSEAKRRLLAKYLQGEIPHNVGSLPPITRRPAGTCAPLSLVQEQAWRHAVNDLGGAYRESITIHRSGSLDVPALERSLAEIIRRHEAWRSTFELIENEPTQVVHPPSPCFSLPVTDLCSLPETVRQTEALRLATEDARKPFDLEQGPFVRARLVRLAEQQYRLYMTVHQCIVDGVSVYQIFPAELTALYSVFSAGNSSPLSELPIQYADFALWERQWLEPALDSQLKYWRKQLSGAPVSLQWPPDQVRPPVQRFRGAIEPFTFPTQLATALKELSQREGVTLFMLLLAGFIALLYRYSRQDYILVGTLAPAGRKRTEVRGLLGYFLNPVAIRTTPSEKSTLRELVTQVRKSVSDALSHDDVPFEFVSRQAGVRPDPSRHPLFQIMFSLAPPMAELGPGWDQTPMDVESGGAKWDLYFELSNRANALLGRAQYNPDLLDSATVQRIVRHYQLLLTSCTTDPNPRLCDLPPDSFFDDSGMA